MNKKTGFTLAEVLITLLVIGVIASLTVPALLQRIQEAELRTAWKSSYSDLKQAVSKWVTDKGGSIKGNSISINDLLRYLTYVKDCSSGNTPDNCWVNQWPSIVSPSGVAIWNSVNGTPSAVLNNGSVVFFHYSDYMCNSNTWSGQIKVCAEIALDVNGIKKPNLVGKDIFFMWLTEDNLIPDGSPGHPENCGSGNWKGCSARYLYQ